ncbi:hypothetical protein Tco_0509953, partial [Tanacetum coccineum]
PWHRNGDDDVVDSVVGCRRGGCDDGGDNEMAVVASGRE